MPALCQRSLMRCSESASLFDHFVSAGEQRRRNGKAEHLCGRRSWSALCQLETWIGGTSAARDAGKPTFRIDTCVVHTRTPSRKMVQAKVFSVDSRWQSIG